MSTKLTSIRGMHDILPAESASWQHLEKCVREVMHSYGYDEMRTPLLERSALFHRGIGEATDIVEKEMYTFPDRKGESLSLRPENTASCVRAALQNGLLMQGAVNRIWYMGPMFRYERPQKGRTRQFHQVGAEVYGVPGPGIEVELIALSARLWAMLGLSDQVTLEINTLGTSAERQQYRQSLVDYFRTNESTLDADSLRRLETNPLRILDSKNPEMQAMIADAPKLLDALSEDSRAHFDSFQARLQKNGITPVINPRLVRGLDYYSHSVWEWTTTLLGAQATVCGGGRYDGLVDELGGSATPAVGWALGMERLLLLVEQCQPQLTDSLKSDVFVVVADDVEPGSGLQLAESIRDQLPGLKVVESAAGGSIKSQFKKADKSGAAVALVLGAAEVENGSVTVKPLRSGNPQQSVSMADLATTVSTELAAS